MLNKPKENIEDRLSIRIAITAFMVVPFPLCTYSMYETFGIFGAICISIILTGLICQVLTAFLLLSVGLGEFLVEMHNE